MHFRLWTIKYSLCAYMSMCAYKVYYGIQCVVSNMFMVLFQVAYYGTPQSLSEFLLTAGCPCPQLMSPLDYMSMFLFRSIVENMEKDTQHYLFMCGSRKFRVFSHQRFSQRAIWTSRSNGSNLFSMVACTSICKETASHFCNFPGGPVPSGSAQVISVQIRGPNCLCTQ